MTKEIEISKGYVAIVDDDNYENLSKMKWQAKNNGDNIVYAITFKRNEKMYGFLMHRIIMNCSEKERVDHINHNGLDNRKENLRVCTQSQNMANRRKNKNNTSGYKGVSFLNDRNKFRAEITHNNIHYKVGCFKYAIDAARAYDKKAKELFGEFALLNFADFDVQ
jgi:hypothetical protein